MPMRQVSMWMPMRINGVVIALCVRAQHPLVYIEKDALIYPVVLNVGTSCGIIDSVLACVCFLTL